jgi:hypothetical protein
MTYIWNRADRVPKENMPHVVEDAFKAWEKDQFKNFEYLSEDKKFKVRQNVSRQLRAKNVALIGLGYYK